MTFTLRSIRAPLAMRSAFRQQASVARVQRMGFAGAQARWAGKESALSKFFFLFAATIWCCGCWGRLLGGFWELGLLLGGFGGDGLVAICVVVCCQVPGNTTRTTTHTHTNTYTRTSKHQKQPPPPRISILPKQKQPEESTLTHKRKHPDQDGRAEEAERHKQDQLKDVEQGKQEWKAELASDGEEAVSFPSLLLPLFSLSHMGLDVTKRDSRVLGERVDTDGGCMKYR